MLYFSQQQITICIYFVLYNAIEMSDSQIAHTFYVLNIFKVYWMNNEE